MLINSYYANLFAKPLHKKTLSCTVIINSLKQWYNTIKYEIDLFTYINARTNAKYSNYLETMHNLNIDLMSCYAVCVTSLGKANDDNELVKRVDKLREKYNNVLMKNKLLFWHSVEPQLIKLRNEFVNKDNKCGNSSSNYCNEVNDDDVVVERENNIKINKKFIHKTIGSDVYKNCFLSPKYARTSIMYKNVPKFVPKDDANILLRKIESVLVKEFEKDKKG